MKTKASIPNPKVYKQVNRKEKSFEVESNSVLPDNLNNEPRKP